MEAIECMAPLPPPIEQPALQTMPWSMEAEQSVLGGMMLDNSVWDEYIADELEVSDFFKREHRLIFTAIAALASTSVPFDVLTVSEKAESEGLNTGGLAYLAELASNIPSVANIKAYVQVVKERSRLRQLSQIGFECSRHASEKGAVSASVLEQTEQRLFAMNQSPSGDFVDLNATILKVVDEIDLHFNSGNPVTGTDTGLQDLNAKTGGLQPGDLVLLGARPSMGKTSLGLQFALSALERAPFPEATTQVYSLEMPAEQIVYRALAQLGHLNASRLRMGDMEDEDWPKLTSAVNKLNALNKRFVLDDTPALSPTALRAKARRAARKFGMPCLIMVDYLQLMRTDAKGENRNHELSEITGALKALAKEMHCPVVALSQLNRAVEQRADKRPNNSDLRDSGAIEQDADVILFIYREEHYNPNTLDKGTAEIIIGKHRNGPTGTVRTAFIAEQTRFADLSSGNGGYGQ